MTGQPGDQTGAAGRLVRRGLVAAVTALVVLRGLLSGSDPGLLSPDSEPLGLTVTLLALAALTAWAAWRLGTADGPVHAGLVDAGLAILLGAFLVGTLTAAEYRRPAWLLSWAVAGAGAVFFLVRQLARGPGDQRGVLAALLATGAMLAGQSVAARLWPAGVWPGRAAALPGLPAEDWGRLRCQMLTQTAVAPAAGPVAGVPWAALAGAVAEAGPESWQGIPLKHAVDRSAGVAELPQALRPRPGPSPAATFAAVPLMLGLLVMVLPALVAGVAAARGSGRGWILAGLACAGMVGTAVAAGQDRLAVLAALGASALVLAVGARLFTASKRGASRGQVVLAALVGGAGLLLAARVSPAETDTQVLVDSWAAGWRVFEEHFWRGVGPGNVGRAMAASTGPAATPGPLGAGPWPCSLFLAVGAAGGIAALAGLLAMLGAFFRRGWVYLAARSPEPDPPCGQPASRAEFYEGGFLGLLLGFVLRALPLEPDQLVGEAVLAGFRAVLWFGAFAALDGLPWPRPARVLAGVAGVGAGVLYLAGSTGGAAVGVWQAAAVLGAVALNGLPETPRLRGRELVPRLLAVAGTAALVLLFYAQMFDPATAAASARRTARALAQNYLDRRGGVTPEGSGAEPIRRPGDVLARVVGHFEQAVAADASDARAWVELADWYAELFEAFPSNASYFERALRYARTAQALDPRGPAGYLAEARLHQLAARRAEDPAVRRTAAATAPSPLARAVALAPADPTLHARLSDALAAAGETRLAAVHAARALALDEALGGPHRPDRHGLTDRQREHLRRRAGPEGGLQGLARPERGS